MPSVLPREFAPAPRRRHGPTALAVAHSAHWRINGFPATLSVWTTEVWERLEDRPGDAQYLACGIWCALRLDDD